MLGNEILNQVRKHAEDVSVREGCTLWDIEFVGSPAGRTLRVYIDKQGGQGAEGGVSIDDCSKVSRELNQILDGDDLIPGGNYNLEVSSPGVERTLKEPWHFESAIGKKISVKAFAPLVQFNPQLQNNKEFERTKQAQGQLLGVDEKNIRLLLNETGGSEVAVSVPFEQITKAHVLFEFEAPGEKKGKLKNKK